MTNAARRFAFTLPIEVTLRDLDGLGHVNNSVYLTYLETARNKYVFSLTRKRSLHEFDFILARTVIDFRSPASFLDTVEVLLVPTRIGNSSFTFAYELREAKSGRLLVEAESVQVCYNYASLKPMPVPAEFRRQLEEEMKRCAG